MARHRNRKKTPDDQVKRAKKQKKGDQQKQRRKTRKTRMNKGKKKKRAKEKIHKNSRAYGQSTSQIETPNINK